MSVLIGDHVAIEQTGRVYGLGLFPQFFTLEPNGMSLPQAVAVVVDVPSRHAGDELPVLIELRDLTLDRVVEFVPPEGGAPQALRVQQLMVLIRPSFPGVYVPAEVPCRAQIRLAFPNGLPLARGRRYQWRVELAGRHLPHWSAEFQVFNVENGPVIGGPVTGVNREDIPSPF